MNSRLLCALLCSLALLGGTLAPVAASVPDARVTITDAGVTPSSPSAEERVSVNFTLANSAGSPSAVDVEEVVLRGRSTFGDTYAEAEDLGALSAGDDLSASLPVRFAQAGAYDLELVVSGEDEDGDPVSASRPVAIDVGPAGDDIEVSASRVYLVETDDGGVEAGGIEELLGSGGDTEEAEPTPVIEVRVSNFGAPTARDVFVRPTVDGEPRPRLLVADVARNSAETVRFETESLTETASIEFTAAYRLSTDDPDDERRTATTTYDYRPGENAVTLTDVEMQRDGERLSITGNAGNLDGQAVESAVLAVGESENVTPTAPQRDYFIGTIPDSDFVTFDLTATVEGTPETVPVTVRYSADGVVYEERVELAYDPVETDEGGSSPLSTILVVLVVVGLLVGVGGYLWRRQRDDGSLWRRQGDAGD